MERNRTLSLDAELVSFFSIENILPRKIYHHLFFFNLETYQSYLEKEKPKNSASTTLNYRMLLFISLSSLYFLHILSYTDRWTSNDTDVDPTWTQPGAPISNYRTKRLINLEALIKLRKKKNILTLSFMIQKKIMKMFTILHQAY